MQDENHAKLETPPRNATKLLHSHRLWFKKFTTHREAKPNSVNWHFHVMYAGKTDHTLILFSDEAWFHLSGYVNSE